MFYNSCPRRYIRLCLQRCQRYHLGRKDKHKRLWLNILSDNIYKIKLGVGNYEDFMHGLYVCVGSNLKSYINFSDDVSSNFCYPKNVKKIFHEPGIYNFNNSDKNEYLILFIMFKQVILYMLSHIGVGKVREYISY